MAHRVIGTSPPRADAWEKVRGRPIYAGDLALAGMLHGRIVRSPYASARILRLDTRAARALHVVAAVLTARDVPRNEQRMELPGRMAEATWLRLADRKVFRHALDTAQLSEFLLLAFALQRLF